MSGADNNPREARGTSRAPQSAHHALHRSFVLVDKLMLQMIEDGKTQKEVDEHFEDFA